MSSLTEIDKRYLEQLLEMRDGYVLDYTDRTFGEFFDRYNVDIHGNRYKKFGTSKAKKLRAFWVLESDNLVGKILAEMLELHEVNCELNGIEIDTNLLIKARDIVRRLCGYSVARHSDTTDSDFLAQEFETPNIQNIPIKDQVAKIVQERLDEARVALTAGAYLSVIFLCGSVLEAVLLGVAQQSPEKYNRANATPKASNGSPKHFHEWSLTQLIDVACEIGNLQPDIKKFSHGLRDFRNYIHPNEQLKSGFTPDEHTAKLCFQVLKAALASVAGERS